MKLVTHWFLLSCYRATILIEKSMSTRLSVVDRIRLKLHKKVCRGCTCYEQQSRIIEEGLGKVQRKIYTKEEIDGLKQVILNRLNQHQ